MFPSLWMNQGRVIFSATRRYRGSTRSRNTAGEKKGSVLNAMSSVEAKTSNPIRQTRSATTTIQST